VKQVALLEPGRESLVFIQETGLQLSSSIHQIGGKLFYESPARLNNASLIGNCRLGAFTYIGAGSEIRNAEIGRFCSIAANVAIGPAEHPLGWLSSHPFQFDGVRYFDGSPEWKKFARNDLRFRGNSASTVVGNDVWIGRNAIIKQGVRIGDGAVVAGAAFVNQNVPPYAIVGGVPAKVLRFRFNTEIIQRLERVQWWRYELNSELSSINFEDVDSTLTALEDGIERGSLKSFRPSVFLAERKGRDLTLSIIEE